jgi:glycosyltransferase involved in cell wall biosynthesis
LDGLKDKSRPWDLDLSIVIPLKDEDRSVIPLKKEIDDVMLQLPYSWECLWIDDGSTDNTLTEIQRFNQQDPRHQYLALAFNCGQSAALHAGFSYARAEVIMTLDGDGQNDPGDLPRLIEHLYKENCDMVNGVRRNRMDSFTRKISSRIANGFRNRLTHENISDVGCSLRVFRHECVQHITPFKGFHRFLPTLVRIAGYTRICQIPVNHRSRRYGQTSYGIHNRLWIGIIDTLAVRWMQSRAVFAKVKSSSGSKGKLQNHE